ncbi:hypothetical protein ACWDRR_26345 [Kitasatospora sp. NPDC003701]
MPHAVASLRDSQLCELLPTASARRAAAEELMRRHGRAALAYARVLCRSEDDATVLAITATNRTLDVFEYGAQPGAAWIGALLDQARHLGATWAASGRSDALSPFFARWLEAQRGAGESHTCAVAGAARNSLLLRTLRTLPEATAAQIWRALTAPLEGTAAQEADGRAPEEAVRREFADAYLRHYAAGTPERHCRHLAARLGDEASGGVPVSAELTTHLSRCDRCSWAMADLRAVHDWEADTLRGAMLLWYPRTNRHRPAAEPDRSATGDGPAPERPPAQAGPGSRGNRSTVTAGRARHRRTKPLNTPTRRRRRMVAGVVKVGTVALLLSLTMSRSPAGRITGALPATAPTDDAVPPSRPSSGETTGQAPGPTPTTGRVPTSAPATDATPAPRSASPPVPAPTVSAPTAARSPTATPAPTRAPVPTGTPSPAVKPPPPTALASPVARVLRRGDSGADVARLQQLLSKAGCLRSGSAFAEGRFDDATGMSLMVFQLQAGLRGAELDSNAYGPATRALLESTATGSTC